MSPEAPIRRLLVTGSRLWPTKDTVLPSQLRVAYAANPSAVLVVGFDPVRKLPAGVDKIAYMLWRKLGGITETHPADWERFGRSAGFRRNAEMVELGADACWAFILNASPGATDCAARAERAGIPVSYFRAPGWFPVTPSQ